MRDEYFYILVGIAIGFAMYLVIKYFF